MENKYQQTGIEQVIEFQKLDIHKLIHEPEKGAQSSEPDAVYYGDDKTILIEHTQLYISDYATNKERQEFALIKKIIDELNSEIMVPDGWCISMKFDLRYFCQYGDEKNLTKSGCDKWNKEVMHIIKEELNQKIEILKLNKFNYYFPKFKHPQNWKGLFDLSGASPNELTWNYFSKLVESVEQREDNLNCYISDHLCYGAWFQPNNISSHIFLGSWSEGGESLDINVINANILKKSKKVINYKKWADKQNIKNPGAWLILDISQKGSGFYLAGHQNELSFDLNLLDNTHNFDAIFIVQGSHVAKIDG